VVDSAIARLGKIDLLVNNAGIMIRAPVLEHSEAIWDEVMNTNVKVPFFLAQACAKHMVDRGIRGRIINMCSIASVHGALMVASYAASKHALAGVTKALATELAPSGINVNAIAPGYVDTEMMSHATATQEQRARYLARVPAGRFGTPEDIAGAVIFLASPASDFIHGEVLMVDGGWRAR
jgi:2-deoxy-D-gluconate 3-dehydrogenase